MPTRGLLVAVGLTMAACQAPPQADRMAAAELAVWLTGTYSSEAQHKQAPRDYFSIRLVMLPIWPQRDDGPWLYVEQAAESALVRPYRQRVYHLVAQPNGTVRSDIYTLPGEPLAWSGAWRHRAPLSDLTPDQLTLRSGCSIELTRIGDDRWQGSTTGNGCPSQRSGAAYATAEVVLMPNRLESWDRGFDGQGKQVWGARLGPYRFDKVRSATPD